MLNFHSAQMTWLHKIADWSALLGSALILDWFFKYQFNGFSVMWIAAFVAFFLSTWLYPAMSVYRPWRGESSTKEVFAVLWAWFVVFLATCFILFVLNVLTAGYGRMMALWLAVGGIMLTLSRLAVRAMLNNARKRGRNQKHIIVVGGGDHASHVAKHIKSNPWTGFSVAGYFSNLSDAEQQIDCCRFLGSYDDVSGYLERHKGIDEVWIALPLKDELLIQELNDSMAKSTVNVRYIPDVGGFQLINHSVSQVAEMPLINLSVSPMEGWNRILKAIEDRLLAGLILTLISPVMIFLAIGVKLTSRGPVFYRQERISWNGRSFEMLKFRSMPVDTEKSGVQWGGGASKATTRFGQFIRKTSLDELPQFINVLKGDMSIVGPRPERPLFVDQFKHEIPGYMQKHKVKAGITGWAQINGWRGDTDLQSRVDCDLYYINNWSVWFDLRIIFLTIFKGFINKNAY